MNVGLDTNVLAYAEGLNGVERQARAGALLAALPADGVVVPVQVLGELFTVLVRKARRPPAAARAAVLGWRDSALVQPTTEPILLAAMDLAADHAFSPWDAVVVAAAAEAGCRLLLSEDMQNGFTWRGLTIVNPFTPEPHPLLAVVLGDADEG